MTELDKRIAESQMKRVDDAFQLWWGASKYCQVALGDHRQVAYDGFRAALADPIIRREIENSALERALNCYSPDDTAADWAEKLERELAAAKAEVNSLKEALEK